MRVLERAVYRGPHLFSATPMVRILLDLEELEEHPTTALPGFADRLLEALPGLARHGCSRRTEGGLVARLRDGTWIGHVTEHVALELQTLAGSPVSRGKTRSVPGRPGVYNVMFAYGDEASGLLAGRMALELVRDLLPEPLRRVDGLDLIAPAPESGAEDGAIPGIAALRRQIARAALGPTTRSIADEARRRGIPVERVDDFSLIRLGQGSRSRMLRASITDGTSHLAVGTAGDKDLTKRLLRAAGVPVPAGAVVQSAEEAVAAARRIGGPVVTKPLDGNHGRGVTLHLTTDAEVRDGFAQAAAHSRRVVVEQQLQGRDYRILVIGGKVAAVAERVPARVIGDGVSTIAQLVDELNADPRRGRGHENVLTAVRIDAHVTGLLAARGLTADSVPALGEILALRDTANLSTGGEAIDRTDDIHPANRALAERAARIVGLDIAGLDVLSPDLARPLAETGGGIVEVNAAPGFRMHLHPSDGTPRNVAAPVVDLLYPRGSRSRIPITAVTGTNGKSTTVRMIAHILAETGVTVGMTTTSGVYVGGSRIKAADASGPKSARMVLADPTVDAAVLETARGGLLREGLAYDVADVGVVLNVSADHLGLKGVDTLEQLAAVKSVVVRQVRRRGTSVLNADDPRVLRMARTAGGRIAYFTTRSLADLPAELAGHPGGGGLLATVEPTPRGGRLVIHDGGESVPVIEVVDIPATLGGTAGFNVQNALAAALAAYAQGVEPGTIAAGLRSFDSSFELNPGRLNITRAPGFTTIVDYAHNPAALRALGEVIESLRSSHNRVIGVVSTPGDRRDEDIFELGTIAAGIFDALIFRERPDGRGRAAGGVVSLLTDGALAAGMPPSGIQRILDEHEAMDAALRMAGPTDLVVFMPTDVDGAWAQVQSFSPAAAAGGGGEQATGPRERVLNA